MKKSEPEDRKLLYDAMLSLETEKDCADFLEDLLTIAELNAATQRIKVAMLLSEKQTCQAIANETGASTATISRVNRCLNYGTGGYKMIIEKLKDK